MGGGLRPAVDCHRLVMVVDTVIRSNRLVQVVENATVEHEIQGSFDIQNLSIVFPKKYNGFGVDLQSNQM